MSGEKWSGFEAYVEQRMNKENIAGAAIAVSQHGNTIYQKGFGVTNIETKQPVTPETVFGIASVTKSFTALAVMMLAEEGKLSVDAPVVKYLPEFSLRGLHDRNSVKVHHLLSHTTGLPPMRRKEELNQFRDHLTYIGNEEYELLGQPGEYFSYSNDAFLLLGGIIEQLTGQLFRRFVTERILQPLQMYRSTFSLEEVAKLSNVSVPYLQDSETGMLTEAAWLTLGNYEVGGGIRSNVLDLLRYGQVFVNAGQSIASERYVSKMRQPVHKIGRNAFYGYGLEIKPGYSGVTLVGHGGAHPGVSAHFGFVPEQGLVAAVLTNVSSAPAEEMWLATVNTALGFPVEQKCTVEPQYEASEEELQRLVGNYQSAEGGNLTIYLEQGTPKAEVQNTVHVLRASGSDTLVFEKGEYPIRFLFKERGRAWAAFFGYRMWTRVP